jgi:hypothetical protein
MLRRNALFAQRQPALERGNLFLRTSNYTRIDRLSEQRMERLTVKARGPQETLARARPMSRGFGALSILHHPIRGCGPRIMKGRVAPAADGLRDSLDFSVISAAVWNVAKRPCSELIVKRILKDRNHVSLLSVSLT